MSNREAWLTSAVELLSAEVFKPVKLNMPEKWAVSCGWVKGMGKKTVAACIDPICSGDGTTHLFVMPTEFEGVEVVGHLAHEMIHAIVGLDQKHEGNFIKVAKALEFERPWKSCGPGPGTKVHDICKSIVERLGPYPHAPVVPRTKPAPGTTEHRWVSRSNPKYGVLISTGTVLKYGRPKDPDGVDMLPKYPERVYGAAPVNPKYKDMYELPTKYTERGETGGGEADDQDD